MKTPKASEIINDLGVSAVADATGSKLNTVRVWRARNRLPRKKWPELLRAFPNLSMDVLLKTERAA